MIQKWTSTSLELYGKAIAAPLCHKFAELNGTTYEYELLVENQDITTLAVWITSPKLQLSFKVWGLGAKKTRETREMREWGRGNKK